MKPSALWAALAATIGHKAKKPTPQDGRQTAATTGIDKQQSHPGNCLTPAGLFSILEDAESGRIGEQHQLFADIEEYDSAIASNLDIRKRALLTLGYTVRPPKDPSPAEQALTDTAIDMLDGLDYFEDLIIDMMDAVAHGFSAVEQSWQYDGKHYYPIAFDHVPPAWFVIKDEDLRLKSRDSQDGQPLWPLGWIVHRHKSRSASLARSGLMRTLAWLYVFKYYSIRDFAEFLELYGLPIRIGKYPAGAIKEEKRTLLRAVADIGHNAAGIMPEGMDIELKDAASGTQGDPFMQMVNWCEKSAARLILGQTLTSGTDTATNTNALGKVHNEVRRDLLVSDAKQVAQTITKQLILPFLQVNYPHVDPRRAPVFEFDTAEYEDVKKYADSLPALVGVGVQIPRDYVNKKLGIPLPADDEAVLGATSDSPATTAELAAASYDVRHTTGCSCSGCVSAASHSRTAALVKNPPSADDPQALLDEQIELSRTDTAFAAQLNPVMQQVIDTLLACDDYEQAAQALATLYPNLDSSAHERYLQDALTLADLLGAHRASS